VLAGLLLAVAAGTAQAAAAFDEAMEHYEQGRWQQAYRAFATLADSGDAEAARIALQMVRYRHELYRHSFEAPRPQIDRWLQLATRRLPLRASAD